MNMPARQQGAALIIGLVLLMILTLLGVSGMTTSTLELVMADNMQRGQYAFQAAESALRSEMGIAASQLNLNGTEVRGDLIRPDIAYNYDDGNGNTIATVDVDTSYQGIVAFGEAAHQVHFESRGEATTPVRGARSAQRIGYFVLAPGGR
ncbi:MAG: hypothetical protein KJO55_03910 [Gammaproteobacteria bacterium]|nr:hypothetical protein [Gammaproteobacteria bacterium]NND60085.1 hypothetical protein [Gammaproteobacteria bacterium]